MPDLTHVSLAELRERAPIDNAALRRVLDEMELGETVCPFGSYID